MGIFSEIAPSYLEQNLVVVPLDGKVPVTQRWPNATVEAMSDYAYFNRHKKLNIGLLTGATNNIVALDLDSYDQLHTPLLDLLPPSPVRKVGKKGVTCFYQFNGEPSKKFYINKQSFCEVLSTGNQTVLPPSIHPETNANYAWLTPDTLLDIPSAELPVLPDNYIELIESIVNGVDICNSDTASIDIIGRHNILFSQIRAAIEKNKSPQEIAFEIFTYDKEHHEIPWLSDLNEKPFHGVPRSQPQRLALAWVMYEYNKVILEKSKEEIDLTPQVDAPVTLTPKEEVAKLVVNAKVDTPRTQFAARLEALAMEAPGVCGDIVRWIVETSRIPQPTLALGAALTVLGTLKAHKVCSEEDLRTNHFIIAVAESGSGKDHPLKCASKLLETVGYDKHVCGDPASEAALIRMAHEAQGRLFIALDEIGLRMKSLNSKNVSNSEMNLLRALTSLWSSSGNKYRGREYANHDNKMMRKDIIQPCLNIYGVTEPISLYQSLKRNEMSGGFLPRWLIMQISNPDTPHQKKRIISVPKDLREQIQIIADREIKYDNTINVNIAIEASALTPKPQIIAYTLAVSDMLDDMHQSYDKRKRAMRKHEKGIDALWARGIEHVVKLALTICDIDSKELDKKCIAWSNEVVYNSLELASNLFLEHAADSPFEERTNKLLSIISKNQGITKAELYNKTRSMTVKERDEALSSLEASSSINVVHSAVENTRKKVTSYFLGENSIS